MAAQRSIVQSTRSSNLADVLERVLDKGVVIAGDIKIKLVDIELLTIQIRLVICSVDKAREMGMDWWARDPNLSSLGQEQRAELPLAERPAVGAPAGAALERRVAELEAQLTRLRKEQP